mmetsp:Transcript_22796/g.60045  ORF Transcript_22796/g.60045 Transcript_22796/m.60045 type:complete len:208 (+) Transcript_22796:195-818(+)
MSHKPQPNVDRVTPPLPTCSAAARYNSKRTTSQLLVLLSHLRSSSQRDASLSQLVVDQLRSVDVKTLHLVHDDVRLSSGVVLAQGAVAVHPQHHFHLSHEVRVLVCGQRVGIRDDPQLLHCATEEPRVMMLAILNRMAVMVVRLLVKVICALARKQVLPAPSGMVSRGVSAVVAITCLNSIRGPALWTAVNAVSSVRASTVLTSSVL